MPKVAFLFPGQGAQFIGMGQDFYESFSKARDVFEEADDLLSLHFSRQIFSGDPKELVQTKNSQLAIFITSVALLRVIESQFPHLVPFAAAGLSLGEYTALLAARKIPFSACLKIVQARGSLMQQACEEDPGTMRVVLGLDEHAILGALPPQVWIANLNCPGQVVIAGSINAMDQAESALKAAGAKRVLPLDVSGAFHTPLMNSAKLKLRPLLEAAPLTPSDIHLVMNVPGAVVAAIPEIRSFLIEQVTATTRWEKGIRSLEESQIDLYLEIGPGKTLSGMNRKIGVKGNCLNIEKVSDLETLYAATSR